MNDGRATLDDESEGALVPCQTSPPHRILVAEDEPSIRQILISSLARAGYRVDAVENGALAWQALQFREYDLLITDNNMPKVTGIELVKKLRDKNSTLPVVMATGVIPGEELEKNPSLGISGILLKPFTIEDVLTTVQMVLCNAGGHRNHSHESAIIQAAFI